MIDDQEIRQVQKKMAECIQKLNGMTISIGMARQVKEFSSDQRKNILAGEQIKFIQRGESVSAAEILARSDPVYLEKMQELERNYADACKTIAEWDATFARLDASRSIHAMFKETLNL